MIYLGFLLGLLAVATVLAVLGLFMQRPGQEKPRRPLPYPSPRAEHPTDLNRGRHAASDEEMGATTTRLWPENMRIDRY